MHELTNIFYNIKVKVPCYDLASVGAQQYDFFLDVHRIGSNDLLQVSALCVLENPVNNC